MKTFTKPVATQTVNELMDALQLAHNALLIAKSRSYKEHGPDKLGEQSHESYQTETLDYAITETLNTIQTACKVEGVA